MQKREEALLAARERMQTLAARNSIIAEERRREAEEEKQSTKAEEWEHHRMFGEGLNNKSSQVDKKPVSLRQHSAKRGGPLRRYLLLTVSNHADVLVRCTGLLQVKDGSASDQNVGKIANS